MASWCNEESYNTAARRTQVKRTPVLPKSSGKALTLVLSDVQVSRSPIEVYSDSKYADAIAKPNSYRCYSKKFNQRRQKRLQCELEAGLFKDALKDHVEQMRQTIHNVHRVGDGEMCSKCKSRIYGMVFRNELQDFLHWGCCTASTTASIEEKKTKSSVVKKVVYCQKKLPARDNGMPQLWLFWSVVFFCCFNAIHEHELSKNERQIDRVDLQCKGKDTKENVGAHAQVDNACNLPTFEAKWLKWPKSRNEVFGYGTEAWHESWCTQLIFGASGESTQHYLWNYLAKDLHKQSGADTQPIPGDWKRRCRVKRRAHLASRKIHRAQTKSTMNSSSSVLVFSESTISEHDFMCADNEHMVSTCDVLQVLRGGGWDEGASSSSKDVPMVSEIAQYEFSLDDFRNNALIVKPQKLAIQWSDDDAVPYEIRNILSVLHQAVETNSDGACALHAVFGQPSGARELFYSGARDLALQCLRALPQAAALDDAQADALLNIRASFWDESAKPLLENTPSVEGNLFWKALLQSEPALPEEARRCFQNAREAQPNAELAKQRVLTAARSFFTLANEEMLIRPIAVRLGYLHA